MSSTDRSWLQGAALKIVIRRRCGGKGISNNKGMPSAPASSPVVCIGGALTAIDTDLLILPWFQDDAASAVAGVDVATGGEVARALASKEFQAKPFDLFVTPIADK